MELDRLAGQVAGRVRTCPVTVAMPIGGRLHQIEVARAGDDRDHLEPVR